MKIYTIERAMYDGYDYDSDCVCASVDINIITSYIRNNPLNDDCYKYYVLIFDGFTGKITHNATITKKQAETITEINFEVVK